MNGSHDTVITPFQEYAIDPEAFGLDHGCVQELLGEIRKSGQIANLLDGEWRREAERVIGSQPPRVPRAMYLELLKHLESRRRLPVRHSGRYGVSGSRKWDKAIEVAHEDVPFEWVVVSGKSRLRISSDRLIKPEDEASMCSWRESWCNRDAVELSSENVEILMYQLAKHSTSLGLIDKYLNLMDDEYKEFLLACLAGYRRLLNINGKTLRRGRLSIRVHTSRAMNVDAWSRSIRRMLEQSCCGHDVSIQAFGWQEHTESERFHNRFILTDQVAIEVGSGFAIPRNESPHSSDLTVKSRKIEGDLRDRFDPAYWTPLQRTRVIRL